MDWYPKLSGGAERWEVGSHTYEVTGSHEALFRRTGKPWRSLGKSPTAAAAKFLCRAHACLTQRDYAPAWAQELFALDPAKSCRQIGEARTAICSLYSARAAEPLVIEGVVQVGDEVVILCKPPVRPNVLAEILADLLPPLEVTPRWYE